MNMEQLVDEKGASPASVIASQPSVAIPFVKYEPEYQEFQLAPEAVDFLS